jgi:NADPH:quinone reductase-like Zn-dependent oxidoreductase
MKAIVCTQYGPPDALQFKEMAKPAPAANEVLIAIRAASANPQDWRIMRGDPFFVRLAFGLRRPKLDILGSDFAGQVEAIGKDVKQFQPGDEVFGAKGFAGGAFAEYVCAREEDLATKPANVSFEQAAAVPIAALTALQGLRDKGRIQHSQKVLVDGASGGVGTFAIQIAKSYGAEVTAVCSTRNLEIARSIGADHVIDYTRENFTRSGKQYDLILAANARHSVFAYRRALNPNGICVKAGGKPDLSGILQDLLLAPILSRFGHKKSCGFIAKMNQSDLILLRDLLETGKVVPVIDKRYPLSETAEALRYLEAGHAQGKVVIFVEHASDK